MTEQWTNPECRQGKHGHEPEPVDCPNCGGSGKVTGDRFIGVTCPRCLGDGAVEPE